MFIPLKEGNAQTLPFQNFEKELMTKLALK
jgi:hypothetical protein